jgi:hypothetical protein
MRLAARTSAHGDQPRQSKQLVKGIAPCDAAAATEGIAAASPSGITAAARLAEFAEPAGRVTRLPFRKRPAPVAHLSCFPSFIRSRSGIAVLLHPTASHAGHADGGAGYNAITSIVWSIFAVFSTQAHQPRIGHRSERERGLTEKYAKKPVIVMNYSKAIKAFYMRLNDDGRTVAAVDVLAPGIGEIIGGSQREERLDVLDRNMAERGIDREHYAWYRDLRRYGTVPYAGFGLGFERTLAYVTGLANVRDAIPFPRTPGNARY